MNSLKKSTTRGFFWSFVDSFGAYFIKFGFTIAIARALSPEDYGTMGMIVIFIALGQILMMSGFSMALIQKKDTTEEDSSTVFWYNLIVSLVVYLILFFTSGAIADFYRSPILKSVTRIAGFGIVITSFACVPVALLTRQMNFRKQAVVNLTASLFSGVFGVIFAYRGFAVWALVIQTLAGNMATSIGFWIICRWRPRFIFDWESFKSMNRYGYKIFLQGLGDVFFTKIYFPLIGKYFPPAQLGYYTNANRFYEIFVRQVSNAFSKVLFPAFSSIQNDNERISRNYLKSTELLFYLEVLAMLILIAGSRSFVSVFLTEKWLPAVPLMMLFFIEGVFFPLLMINHNLLCSIGKSGTSLKIDIVKKALTFGSIFLTFQYGIRALIIGQLAASFISFLISVYVVFRTLLIKDLKILNTVAMAFLIAAICACIHLFLITKYLNNDWLLLLADITVLPTVYFGLSALFRIRVLKEILPIIRSMLNPEATQ